MSCRALVPRCAPSRRAPAVLHGAALLHLGADRHARVVLHLLGGRRQLLQDLEEEDLKRGARLCRRRVASSRAVPSWTTHKGSARHSARRYTSRHAAWQRGTQAASPHAASRDESHRMASPFIVSHNTLDTVSARCTLACNSTLGSSMPHHYYYNPALDTLHTHTRMEI